MPPLRMPLPLLMPPLMPPLRMPLPLLMPLLMPPLRMPLPPPLLQLLELPPPLRRRLLLRLPPRLSWPVSSRGAPAAASAAPRHRRAPTV